MAPRLAVEQGQQTSEIAGDKGLHFSRVTGQSIGGCTGSAGELGTYMDHWMPLIWGTLVTVTSASAQTRF